METPTAMISAAWDALIAKYAAGVPVAFVRALIHGESGGDPRKRNPSSHATGLLQITEIVRRDWNEGNPTAPVSSVELFNPEINIRIGAALLNRIVRVYGRHPTLQPDWTSRRFAELVVLGWNAGYSDGGGVGALASQFEAAGAAPDDVTVDSIARLAASSSTGSRFVARPDRVAYAKAVADLYLGSRQRPVMASAGGAAGPIVIAALGTLGLAHFGKKGRNA